VRDSTSGRYKWVALSNTTLSITMATIDASIVIIAMPAIFRGIHLDPLPDLISGPFQDGLVVVFALATALTALAALASALRGGRPAPPPDSGPQPQTSAKPV
jgi:hypothetical protein